MKLLAVTLLLLICSAFKDQADWERTSVSEASKEILEINTRILKQTAYSFDVTYKSYKSHATKEVYEQKNGNVIRSGINYRSELFGKLIVQNKNMRVSLDTSSKIIKVSNPLEGIEINLNPQDYTKVLGACKEVRKKTEGDLIGFRFEMKGDRGLVTQELFFDGEFIKHLTYYYINEHVIRENNTIKEEILYPKVSIDLNNFKKGSKFNDEIFNTSSFVTQKKGKLIPSALYKNYKLIDGRYYK